MDVICPQGSWATFWRAIMALLKIWEKNPHVEILSVAQSESCTLNKIIFLHFLNASYYSKYLTILLKITFSYKFIQLNHKTKTL